MIGAGEKMVKRKRSLCDGGRISAGEVRKQREASPYSDKRQRLAMLQSCVFWNWMLCPAPKKGSESSGSSLETNAWLFVNYFDNWASKFPS